VRACNVAHALPAQERRGQEDAWKNMNHFSGPLTHLRIRRAAPVHAAAFICPAAPWLVSPSRYVRNNFVKLGAPNREYKKGFEKRIRPK